MCSPLYREQGFITGIYYAQFVQQSRKYQTDKFVYAAIASFGRALFKTKRFNIIWLLQAKHEKNYGLNQEICWLYDEFDNIKLLYFFGNRQILF